MCTFIHLLNKHLLLTYYLTSTVFVPDAKKNKLGGACQGMWEGRIAG